MSWIQNRSKGTYLFLSTRRDPKETSITLSSEVGRNAVVGPGHFRLVDDSHFKKDKHLYVVAVLTHRPGGKPLKWVSRKIGPGEFWVFDGKKFSKPERRSKANVETIHGL